MKEGKRNWGSTGRYPFEELVFHNIKTNATIIVKEWFRFFLLLVQNRQAMLIAFWGKYGDEEKIYIKENSKETKSRS